MLGEPVRPDAMLLLTSFASLQRKPTDIDAFDLDDDILRWVPALVETVRALLTVAADTCHVAIF